MSKVSTIRNGAELLKMNVQKIPTLVDPIIPKVCVMALTGTSDVGKSTLLLQLCTDVALNKSFLDFPLNAEYKSTLYVSTEDDEFTISNRLQRLKGSDEQKLQKMRFLFCTDNLTKKLDAELRKHEADVVVIDTFADIFTGEMNQVNKVRSFMNDYFNLAVKHKCVVIFNHHTGKYTEEKPPHKNNVIGSQGFEGKCRLVLELRPDYEDCTKKHLCIVKGNYLGNEFKQRSYELSFDKDKGFASTGNSKPFDQLAKPKLLKVVANNEVEKKMAIKLRTEKKSYREIAQLVNVPKSTVAEWLKPLSDQSKDLELLDTGQVES